MKCVLYFYRTVPNRKFKCSFIYTCSRLDANSPKPSYYNVGLSIRNYVF